MSRKRSSYRPGRVDPMAAARAITAVRPMSNDKQLDLALSYRTAFEALRTGGACENDLHTLAAAVNIGLILCENGVGEDYIDVAKDAQQAMMRVLGRAQATGRFGLDGPAIGELALFCDLHDQQLQIATQGLVSAVVAEVRRRVVAGQTFEVMVPG